MKIRFLPFILLLVFIFIFLIFYKGLQNTNIYTPNVNTKDKIPLFIAEIFNTNTKINSKKIFIGDRFYLVNIWASWCVPCRKEHKYLINLSKSKNVKIVGINYKDKVENANNFLKDLGNPYDLIISDTEGTLAINWGAYGVPESFLIYESNIIKKMIGPIDEIRFNDIKELIK